MYNQNQGSSQTSSDGAAGSSSGGGTYRPPIVATIQPMVQHPTYYSPTHQQPPGTYMGYENAASGRRQPLLNTNTDRPSTTYAAASDILDGQSPGHQFSVESTRKSTPPVSIAETKRMSSDVQLLDDSGGDLSDLLSQLADYSNEYTQEMSADTNKPEKEHPPIASVAPSTVTDTHTTRMDTLNEAPNSNVNVSAQDVSSLLRNMSNEQLQNVMSTLGLTSMADLASTVTKMFPPSSQPVVSISPSPILPVTQITAPPPMVPPTQMTRPPSDVLLPPGVETLPVGMQQLATSTPKAVSPPKQSKDAWMEATREFEQRIQAKTQKETDANKSLLEKGKKEKAKPKTLQEAMQQANDLEKQMDALRTRRTSVGSTAEKLERELGRLKRQHGELCRKAQREKGTQGHQHGLMIENERLQREIEKQLSGNKLCEVEITKLVSTCEAQLKVLREDIKRRRTEEEAEAATKTGKDKSSKSHRGSSKDSKERSRSHAKSPSPVSSKKKKKRDKSKSPSPVADKKKEKRNKSDVNESSEEYNYVYYDPGSHWCRECNTTNASVIEHLSHLHTMMHRQRINFQDRPWVKPESEPDKDVKLETKVVALKGTEFLMPCFAYYCTLCEEFSGDPAHAEAHLKTESHRIKYEKLLETSPEYEKTYQSIKSAALTRKTQETAAPGAFSDPNLIMPIMNRQEMATEDLRIVVNPSLASTSSQNHKFKPISGNQPPSYKDHEVDSRKVHRAGDNIQIKVTNQVTSKLPPSKSPEPKRHSNKRHRSRSRSRSRDRGSLYRERRRRSRSRSTNRSPPPNRTREFRECKADQVFTSAPVLNADRRRPIQQSFPKQIPADTVRIAQAIERNCAGKATPDDLEILKGISKKK